MARRPSVTIMGNVVWLDQSKPLTWTDAYAACGPANVWSLPCSTPPQSDDLASLVAAEQVVDAIFDDGVNPPKNVKGVWVIKELSSAHPFHRRFLVSDPRCLFQRRAIRRDFNHAAPSGLLSRGITAAGQTQLQEQIQPLVTALDYRLYSVKAQSNPVPFTPVEMLTDVLTELCLYASAMMGRTITPVVNVKPRTSTFPQVLISGDEGDEALNKLLGAVGGCDCRYDSETQSVIVEDRRLGDEIPLVQSRVSYDAEGWGKLRLIDLKNYRPKAYNVGWWIKAEVRADFVEGATITTTNPDAPYWTNVAPVTDQVLKDPQTGSFFQTTQLMEFNAWVASIQNLADYPTGSNCMNVPFTVALLRQFWNSEYLEQNFANPNVLAAYLWSPRLATAKACYRQLFRLNPRFVSQCIPGSIEPYRVAFLDPITRRRSPSPVFMDWFDLTTMLGFDQTNLKLGANRDSFPPLGGSQTGTKTYTLDQSGLRVNASVPQMVASPFMLTNYDADIGAFALQSVRSLRGTDLQLIPSRIPQPPSGKLSDLAVGDPGVIAACPIADAFAFSTIFSAMPGGPNNENAWYQVPVTPGAALLALGISLPDQRCLGADVSLETKPALDTAKIQWDDAAPVPDQILSLFQTGTEGIGATQLVPINKAELYDASVAIVAAELVWMLDHYVGQQRVTLDTSIRPMGSIHTVVHGLDTNGCLGTTINCDDKAPSINVEALMTKSTRIALTGELQ